MVPHSQIWNALFLAPKPAEETRREVAFLSRMLPLPHYRRVVDLCCGLGRHSRMLSALGYEVLAVDREPGLLEQAKALGLPPVCYRVVDMRRIDTLTSRYDAIVNLWQSFGFHDDATNEDILRQIADRLNAKGRLVLDVYNREAMERLQGERTLEREGHRIVEKRRLDGPRETVRLRYDDGNEDVFDWRLYTPDELTELAARFGLSRVLACTWFDESRSPSAEEQRMQLVFQKAENPD